MPRRNRSNYLRPVNSLKHVVDIQGGLTVGTQVNNLLVDTVDNPVSTDTATAAVRTGAVVKSIYLNCQIYATSTAALANAYMVVMKSPGNAIGTPVANQVGQLDTRKLVIHQEMVMMEKNTTGLPRTLFQGVLKIPRHMQRFGVDDALNIGLLTPGVTADFCIQCIFKELY